MHLNALFHTKFLRRGLCGLCAFALLAGVVLPPAAHAAGAEDAGSEPAAAQLTAGDAKDMAAADEALAALTESSGYAALAPEEQAAAAAQTLEELAGEDLIQADSIYYDQENRMYTFSYACGVWGGLLLDGLDGDDSEEFALSLEDGGLDFSQLPYQLPGELEEENGSDVLPLANAIIYYAFDSGVNSTRYPYYKVMQDTWNKVGLSTTLDSEVTVRDLRHMDDYDLCILSAHGLYYTYTYNFAFFWQRTETAPILILMEEANFWKDLSYAWDLLCHRVIKINGQYCLMPSFFTASYPFNALEGTIVLSEACEFLGVDRHVDFSMTEALLNAGAKAVVGYVNTVYTVYSRNLVWDTVNQMIMGSTIQQALQHAIYTYGADDVSWYYSQGGTRAHSPAAYPVLGGDRNAVLYSLTGYMAPAGAA